MARPNFIKSERMKKNMTQKEFASFLDIDQPRLSLLEKSHFPFRVEFVFKLQKKLHIDASDLLSRLSRFKFN